MTKLEQLRVRRGETIPDFTLPDGTGQEISTRAFYMRRNLVIGILPRRPEPGWSRWVQQLGQAAGQIPAGDAAVLVVTPPEMDASLREAIEGLPESVYALFDGENLVGDRFGTPGDDGTLIIADRYGVAFIIETGAPNDEQLDPAGIPDWVEFIACQCS